MTSTRGQRVTQKNHNHKLQNTPYTGRCSVSRYPTQKLAAPFFGRFWETLDGPSVFLVNQSNVGFVERKWSKQVIASSATISPNFGSFGLLLLVWRAPPRTQTPVVHVFVLKAIPCNKLFYIPTFGVIWTSIVLSTLSQVCRTIFF